MSAGVLAEVSVTSVVERLRARATRAAAERCLPTESIDDLRRLGVFRALTPARYGGAAAAIVPLFESLVHVAEACASSAWVGSLFSLHAFLIGRFPEPLQDEVWAATPDALVASSVAPRGEAAVVPDGFRIHGTWSYASGVDHAQWAILTSLVRQAQHPAAACLFAVPARDYRIEDDWFVSGLQGTGSKTIRIESPLFVPAHRTRYLAHLDGQCADAAVFSPLARIPWQSLFSLAFAPAAIGTAAAATKRLRELLAVKRSAYAGKPLRDSPLSVARLARTVSDVDAATLRLQRDVADLQRCADAGSPLSADVAERIIFDAAEIVDCSARAVERAFRGGGGAAIRTTSALQQHFRDMYAITQHAAVEYDGACERYGASLLPPVPPARRPPSLT
ncbi:MAG: hypothetical protein ACRD3G_09570 [Vicinamibacterales bacterium]